MATRRGMHQLAGRALVDEAFRDRLREDPVAAGREERVHISAADAAFIRSLNWVEFDRMGRDMGRVLPHGAAAWGGASANAAEMPGRTTGRQSGRSRGR